MHAKRNEACVLVKPEKPFLDSMSQPFVQAQFWEEQQGVSSTADLGLELVSQAERGCCPGSRAGKEV